MSKNGPNHRWSYGPRREWQSCAWCGLQAKKESRTIKVTQPDIPGPHTAVVVFYRLKLKRTARELRAWTLPRCEPRQP